jgi:polyhydroxyalkanoate synthesis regulator phasin
MTRWIEKSLLLGLGVLTLTRDRAVQFVNRMVEEGEVKLEEAPGVIDKLVDRGKEEREELRKLVREELDKVRSHAPLVSRKDFEELNRKIDELTATVEEMTGK